MRVPFVLLTGFLGSGKTTLVNRILARRAERGATGKLGLVVNELGAVGIDGALLGGDAARQLELPGGCVCCVLNDDLDRTLIELIDSVPDLDAILLETTGVAEPLPIAWAISREPVASRIRLAAVVTLVDATHFHASRSMSGAVDAQVAYADALLVTKSELAGAEATRAVMSEIRTLAPRALIRDGSTDEHARWLEDVLVDPVLESPQPSAPHADDHDHDHDHGIASAWVPVRGIVDLEELEDQLADLPGHYVRIKGIVFARDGRGGDPEPRWTAVHRVGLRVSSEPVPPPPFAEGRLVGLGPGVTTEDLADCVERSLHVSTA